MTDNTYCVEMFGLILPRMKIHLNLYMTNFGGNGKHRLQSISTQEFSASIWFSIFSQRIFLKNLDQFLQPHKKNSCTFTPRINPAFKFSSYSFTTPIFYSLNWQKQEEGERTAPILYSLTQSLFKLDPKPGTA